jgi:hypothetical protein
LLGVGREGWSGWVELGGIVIIGGMVILIISGIVVGLISFSSAKDAINSFHFDRLIIDS